MEKYLIADTIFEFDTKYEYTKQLCKDYICKTDIASEYTFSISNDDLNKEIALNPNYSPDYLESLAVYRKIIAYILKHKNGLFLHCAAISYKGKGYLFLAKSGVGKSTHIGLWKKCFNNDVVVINGDKPVIRYIDGEFVVYGTPWMGKERLGKNISCKISACAFIERAEINSITKASADYFVKKIFEQVVRPTELTDAEITTDLLEKFFKEVPFYILKCNISEESAIIAKNAMVGEV